MIKREKVIKELESLRDICNAKSNMAIGNGKVAWAGYANAAEDAIAMLKEQQAEIARLKAESVDLFLNFVCDQNFEKTISDQLLAQINSQIDLFKKQLSH